MTQNHEKSDIVKYTTCGYHCLSQCILKVHIRDGVIIACAPDDTINANIARDDAYLPEEETDQSMLQVRPCAKGYAQGRMVADPNRVKYPMKRVGKRGEAKFERISWDEALDTIAQKLVETKKKYGPYSILHHPYSMLGNSSFPLGPYFGVGIAGWAAQSLDGWEEPDLWVHGKVAPELFQDSANIYKSKLIVLWGSNPVTTFNGGMVYEMLRAKERGIPIIAIEPRYTASVELLADQWIPIRPTTDVAMMLAMANVLFKENLCDNEFVKKYIEPEGLARWKAYVLGMTDGTDKTPEWAETICGVPAETISSFARLYAQSKPVNLKAANAIGRQFYGENPARAAMYLQALTGNSCIPGGTAAAETGNWDGHVGLPKPDIDLQRAPGSYKAPTLLCGYKWLKAIDIREKLDKGEISKEEYNNIIGNLPENEAPNIQMVILQSNNHMTTLPDINKNISALNKLGFLLVFSHYLDMPSARYADIILPQMATAFEGRDIGSWVAGSRDMFRIGKNPGNYFMYCQKCVDAQGESKAAEWVWLQIAKRLGIAELFSPRLANVPDNQWDEVVEDLHKEAYEKWALKKEIAPMNPPNWEEFQKKPVFRWKIEDPYHAFKEDIDKGENPFQKTESGQMEFYSKKLAKGPAYLATHDFVPGTGRCYGGGNLPPMAQMSMGGKNTFYSKDSEKYPLLMSSCHSLYRVHSFLDNQPLLRDCYRHAVWMNVADAKLRNIKDNEMVRVYNDTGEIIIPAYVTSRLVMGTVCVFHGSWDEPGETKTSLMPNGIDMRGAANNLISNEDLPETIIGHLPCKGLVQVEKWEGA